MTGAEHDLRKAVIGRTGMNVTTGVWIGDHLNSVETVCRRLEGKIIKQLAVWEGAPHQTAGPMIDVDIDFNDGDSWGIEVETPTEARACYMRNRGVETEDLDVQRFPGFRSRLDASYTQAAKTPPAEGMNVTTENWRGSHLNSVETVCRRLEGKIIKQLAVWEGTAHEDVGPVIVIQIDFNDGDSWGIEVESPTEAHACYMRNRGVETEDLDVQEFPGVRRRRRASRETPPAEARTIWRRA